MFGLGVPGHAALPADEVMEKLLAAVHESAIDAVDGSSTGT